MNVNRFAILVVSVMIAGCQATSPLTSEKRELPKFTRTGAIHDIRIGEAIAPPQITVKPGDEVRWVNTRSAPGQIVFMDTLVNRVSCHHKFSGKDSTPLQPNEYISLCFSSPGTYKYIARMGAPVPGGEKNLSGIVQVQVEDITPGPQDSMQSSQSNPY